VVVGIFLFFFKNYLHLLNNQTIQELLLRILIIVSGSHFLALNFIEEKFQNKMSRILQLWN